MSSLDDTWALRLSAGYMKADPYSRPVGTIPLSCHPLGADPCRDAEGNALPGGFPLGGAPYPADTPGVGNQWVNNGTSQPKFDLRLDQEVGGGGRITYQGGYAGTEGIIHTGIGPTRTDRTSTAMAPMLATHNAIRAGGMVTSLRKSARVAGGAHSCFLSA